RVVMLFAACQFPLNCLSEREWIIGLCLRQMGLRRQSRFEKDQQPDARQKRDQGATSGFYDTLRHLLFRDYHVVIGRSFVFARKTKTILFGSNSTQIKCYSEFGAITAGGVA